MTPEQKQELVRKAIDTIAPIIREQVLEELLSDDVMEIACEAQCHHWDINEDEFEATKEAFKAAAQNIREGYDSDK